MLPEPHRPAASRVVRRQEKCVGGTTRQAALLTRAVCRELKSIIFVDEDADLFDTDEVLWAMRTRFSGDMDTIFVQGGVGGVLDPSQTSLYAPRVTAKGTTTRAIVDGTGPFHLKEHVARAQFKELDPGPWTPLLFGKGAS